MINISARVFCSFLHLKCNSISTSDPFPTLVFLFLFWTANLHTNEQIQSRITLSPSSLSAVLEASEVLYTTGVSLMVASILDPRCTRKIRSRILLQSPHWIVRNQPSPETKQGPILDWDPFTTVVLLKSRICLPLAHFKTRAPLF